MKTWYKPTSLSHTPVGLTMDGKYKLQDKRSHSTLGFKLIPNCESFHIERESFCPKLASLGIFIRPSKRDKITIDPYYNSKMNKYLKFQINRLNKIRQNDKKNVWYNVLYWSIVWKLMRRSVSFKISALSKVWPRWYAELPLYFVVKVLSEVRKLAETKSVDLKFRRVYINDGKKTHRPLGVPSLSWRIYLHMLNNFCYIYMKPNLPDNQHGFIPGRGTLTAWKAIIPKLFKAFIYESDLQSFFPSVQVSKVGEALRFRYKFTMNMVSWIESLSRKQPTLPEVIQSFDEHIKSRTIETERLRNIAEEIDKALALQIKGYTKYYTTPKPSISMENTLFEVMKDKTWRGWQGLPQGAPTSPLLSITVLDKFLGQQDSVAYADDQVWFGDTAFDIKNDPKSGVSLNEIKSKWVKSQGKWLSPLKFLGIIYDPFKNCLQADTRKGSKLVLSRAFRDQILNSGSDLVSKNLSLSPWERLFDSEIIGYLWACLYTGSWTPGDFPDKPIEYNTKSWTKLYYDLDKGHNIHNRSSFASYHLANICGRKWWRNTGMKRLQIPNLSSFSMVNRGYIRTRNKK